MLNNRQQSGRRRGRGGQRQQGGRDNGNRIDNRARGNAPQLLEKYKSLARDSQLSGDRVMTEYYLQFADHYFRVVAENRARFEENRRQRDDWQGDDGYEGEEQNLSEGLEGEEGSEDEGRERQPQRREFRNDRGERNDRNRDRGDRNNRFNGNRNREDDRQQARGEDEDRDEPGRIDVAVLPPAFASDGPMPSIDEPPVEAEEAPAPRRRGRPRRSETEAQPEG